MLYIMPATMSVYNDILTRPEGKRTECNWSQLLGGLVSEGGWAAEASVLRFMPAKQEGGRKLAMDYPSFAEIPRPSAN
jgi:hypothetical protein